MTDGELLRHFIRTRGTNIPVDDAETTLDSLLAALARAEAVIEAVEAVCAEYDHADQECEGECCVDRKTVTADFRAVLAGQEGKPADG